MTTSGFQVGYQQSGDNGTLIFVRNNAPVSNQYNGACPKGGLVLDMTGGVLYQNTGTLAATTWAALGSTPPSPLTLPASINGSALATADPHSTGSLWNSSGVVTVSAG